MTIEEWKELVIDVRKQYAYALAKLEQHYSDDRQDLFYRMNQDMQKLHKQKPQEQDKAS
jgi:phage-related protein